MKVRYDKIGIGYDEFRQADPYLSRRMYEMIKSNREPGLYLDVGCGTGNYTCALNEMGLNFIGIDPSPEMINKAKTKKSTIDWKQGFAENIPLESELVDGALLSLTIHHWKDLNKGFKEVYRVLKRGSNLVLFTILHDQTKAYWIDHYFPKMIDDSIKISPNYRQIEEAFSNSGLEIVSTEKYFVKEDLQDCFLYSGKHNPEIYFNKALRQGISSFSLLAHQEELENGLIRLRKDIDSGNFKKIKKQYENELGDYLFIQGRKK